MFSQKVYEQVVEAYLSGLEALRCARVAISHRIASVASFFVSRIDVCGRQTASTKRSRRRMTRRREELKGLAGKVAIANAKLAYQRYKRLFAGRAGSS